MKAELGEDATDYRGGAGYEPLLPLHATKAVLVVCGATGSRGAGFLNAHETLEDLFAIVPCDLILLIEAPDDL